VIQLWCKQGCARAHVPLLNSTKFIFRTLHEAATTFLLIPSACISPPRFPMANLPTTNKPSANKANGSKLRGTLASKVAGKRKNGADENINNGPDKHQNTGGTAADRPSRHVAPALTNSNRGDDGQPDGDEILRKYNELMGWSSYLFRK
jgi:hypothetical protein